MGIKKGRSLRILLVDVEGDKSILKPVLRSPHRPECATDGGQAFGLFRLRRDFEVIVTNYGDERMTLEELWHGLRAFSESIPIIAIVPPSREVRIRDERVAVVPGTFGTTEERRAVFAGLYDALRRFFPDM